jgi:hypothetical protein
MNTNSAMGLAAAGDHHGLAGLHRIQQAGELVLAAHPRPLSSE